jgi:hypothetical protein
MFWSGVYTLLQELDLLLQEAARSGVQPVIGMRAKLATRHGGHWGTSSGENAKFGLSPRDMVAVVKRLSALGMAGCLQLLHYHIGSQVRTQAIVYRSCTHCTQRRRSLGSNCALHVCGMLKEVPGLPAYICTVQCMLNGLLKIRVSPLPALVSLPLIVRPESGSALHADHQAECGDRGSQ